MYAHGWAGKRSKICVDINKYPRAYYIRLVNATNVAKQAAMMIIDQTSSPLSRTRPFQFNGDRSVLWPSFIANIMWKLKISSIGIMRHSGMTRYASVSFSLLFSSLEFFVVFLAALATIFASTVIVIIFSPLSSSSSSVCLYGQFSIRLILIASRVINTVISFIVSLCLYGSSWTMINHV